jgi:hypothetical protein
LERLPSLVVLFSMADLSSSSIAASMPASASGDAGVLPAGESTDKKHDDPFLRTTKREGYLAWDDYFMSVGKVPNVPLKQ